jgi:hypothetical protein
MSDKLTGPMRVVLLGAHEDGIVRWLYSGGQQRLIVAGLVRRGLVERTTHHYRLTPEGVEAAQQLASSAPISPRHFADGND